MHRLLSLLREHRHFLIVVSLLTLVTTFPTIVYIFKTDVFWLPSRNWDIYNWIWDSWYGQLVLTGQADRFYTNLMFYPEGIDLSHNPTVLPNIVAVNVFKLFLPLSNAFCLAWLVIVFSCALSAYVYLLWLFEDKWIALLGAVVFGFSPHVVGEPHHTNIAYVVPIPLVLYCFHRGVREQRKLLILLAGVLTGLTGIGLRYTYVIILIILGLYVCVLAISRWRDQRYWRYIALLILAVAISSFWGVYPLISDRAAAESVLGWYSGRQLKSDLISFFVNHEHPLFGSPLASILRTPHKANTSSTSFLGYVPLLLIGYGLLKQRIRRKMLPWVILCGIFLILRLGPVLNINGVVFSDILLPKYYLDHLRPGVFQAFWVVDQFMAGAILPLAVLTCYGLVALQRQTPSADKPVFILALVMIVAFEYHIPVQQQTFPQNRFEFIDWLKSEEDKGEIRLVYLPMGFHQSKLYNLYQALSGFPHAEGATSRRSNSAFAYLNANFLLRTWVMHRPVDCELSGRDAYLSALAKLEADGFSHVVVHPGWGSANHVEESLVGIDPAYSDEFVAVFRLNDLRESCPRELSEHHLFRIAYADALRGPSILDERHGIAVVSAPTKQTADYFMRYLRHFAQIDRNIVTIASDAEANISIQSTAFPDSDALSDLHAQSALWLVNSQQQFNAETTPAFQPWFTERFHFCQRAQEIDGVVIDLFLRAGVPCSAMSDSSALEVQYDGGVRLRNASYAVNEDSLQFYLAWTNATTESFGFSLQFFDESGNKSLQYDNVIYRQLLGIHEIDISSLPPGAYSVQLIVYDFETQVSQGGTISDTGQRVERELEIARIEL